MIIETKPIGKFLGLNRQYDVAQLPLGAAVDCQDMAQFSEGRLQRIPGVTALAAASVAASTQIPLLKAKINIGGTDYTMAVLLEGTAVKIFNLTTGQEVTGPALTGAFGGTWSYTFYAQKHLIAGGGNQIQEITNATTRINLVGTNVPVGDLVQSYMDRLYVAGIAAEPGIVRYTDAGLTFVFSAVNVVNLLEIAGKVTALAVNSPSTDTAGIGTDLIPFKESAIWSWDETSKDTITQVIGTKAFRTVANTPVGLIFLGTKGNIYSVFYMPIGTPGEPKDIGESLYGLFNETPKLANPEIAFAVYHDGFYKLYFTRSGTIADESIWLDINAFPEIVWYGVHLHGGLDAASPAAGRLELARRGAIGANIWFKENEDRTSGFLKTDGSIMQAKLNMPLNVEASTEEKIYDGIELQIAKEANVAGNAITFEPFADEDSQGEQAMGIYDSAAKGVARALVPLHASDAEGMPAYSARLVIKHSLNTRLDILGAVVQYERYEDKRIRN